MRYLGMDQRNGGAVSDIGHIRQSVSDILLTPIGSRLARRNYGSLLFELLDQPQNNATRLQVMAAAYTAISHWEPRVSLTGIILEITFDGKMVVDLTGTRTDAGVPLSLTIPVS